MTPRYVVRYATCQQTLEGLHWVVDRKTDEVLSNPEPWDVAKADADARNAAAAGVKAEDPMAALLQPGPSGFYDLSDTKVVAALNGRGMIGAARHYNFALATEIDLAKWPCAEGVSGVSIMRGGPAP